MARMNEMLIHVFNSPSLRTAVMQNGKFYLTVKLIMFKMFLLLLL